MDKRTFCANTTLAAGIFIFLGGVAHTVLGLPDLNAAIVRGDVAAYAYSYPNPHFLSFIAVGVLLYLPLAVYYRHFSERC